MSQGKADGHGQYHLAQLNVGKILYAQDSEEMSGFVNALDEINALAEATPGFVWRLKGDAGNAMDYTVIDDETLVNMSVWKDRDSLFGYVYRSAHTAFLARRKEWFHMPTEGHMVLWWVPAGHEPTIDEAVERLMYLRDHGPTPMAFTFKRAFGSDGEPLPAAGETAKATAKVTAKVTAPA
ncbi:DUF3291 domain-containing protein [Kordiimonas sp.]|uniref:DUF3291 domain-containing protein n=1 Tax=Kordiimonas sp. TaxID=1970157 RepID=UPI003A9586BC